MTQPNTDQLKSEIRKALEEERRKRTLSHLIKEAVINIVAEQQMDQQQQDFQAPPQSAVPPAPAPVAPEQPQEPEAATVEGMTEKLNVIRGGRSFSEPEVFGQLTTFWKTLTPEQQELFDNQLNEIGKIVTLAEPEEASQPDPAQQATPPPPPGNAPAPGTPPGGGAPPITPTM